VLLFFKSLNLSLLNSKHLVLSYPFRRAAGLNYTSPRTIVALENGQLPTTRQEPELMFRNNGLLHHNVTTDAGLQSSEQCWQTTSVHPRFAIWAD